jgi:aspartate racemase
MHRPLIGILAGMGPRSTAPFVDMAVTECQRQYGATYDDDFPPMMIYALPTPFYLDRPIDHAALEATIRAGLQRLAATGAAFIAMPCNTAHIYYPALAASIQIPLLNMVAGALDAVPPAARTIALLATRPTVAARVYQPTIERTGRALVCGEPWQSRLDRLIAAIKSSPDRHMAAGMWQELTADLAASGVDTILLACTDLNAVSAGVPPGMTVVDATQCLASAAVRRWCEMVEQVGDATTPSVG